MNKCKLAVIAGGLLLWAGLASAAGAEEGGDVQLPELEITAARLSELNPAQITVIDAEQIKTRGARNVAEALKDVPGLSVTTNNAQGKAIAQFRGSDADNTKVFVDGVPLSPVADGKVDLRVIPADNIEKIEVIKGVAPVVYGCDAPGGIIFITTKQAGDKTGLAATYSIASHRGESLFGCVSGKKDRLSYLLDLKTEHTDGYTVHAKSKEEYFNGKLNYELSPKASLSIFGSYTEAHQQIPNRIDPVTGEMILTGSLGSISGGGSYWAQTFNWEYAPRKNTYTGLLYNQKLNDKSDLSLKLYRTGESSNLRAYSFLEPDASGHVLNDGTVKGVELQHTIKTGRANTLTWGYAYETRNYWEKDEDSYWRLLPGGGTAWVNGFDRSDYDYTGKSFYVQDTVNFGRKLALIAGYRHYDISDNARLQPFGHQFNDQHGRDRADTPEVNFNYALTARTFLHGALGKSYRWPNVMERMNPGGMLNYRHTGASRYLMPGVDPNVTPDARPYMGTDGVYWYLWDSDGRWHKGVICDNVLPEEAINRELGLTHTFPFGLKCDLTYFSKNITNMIKGQAYVDTGPRLKYYNLPSVQMHGYEAEISQPFGKRLKGFLNYSCTNAWDPLLEQQVRDIPLHKYFYGLNYRGGDGVNAYLGVSYVGACTSDFCTGNGNGNGNAYDDAAVKLPGYHTVDLKVSKEIKNEEYYVRITNLFDRKYWQGAYLIAPGRCVEMGATVKF